MTPFTTTQHHHCLCKNQFRLAKTRDISGWTFATWLFLGNLPHQLPVDGFATRCHVNLLQLQVWSSLMRFVGVKCFRKMFIYGSAVRWLLFPKLEGYLNHIG